MPDTTFQADPAFGPAGPIKITFQTFAAQRQAALAPDPTLGITRVTLIKIGSRWHNAFNEATIRRADDLFACAANNGAFYDPVPQGADITEVTLEIQFADSPDPHVVELKPPNGIILQDASDAPRILAFLSRRGFVS